MPSTSGLSATSRWPRKTKTSKSRHEGFDFLKPVLTFDPKLQGPARDRELVFKYYQLAGKLTDYLGEPRLKPPRK